ncbi:MAG: hypothetical protein A2513_08015 [Sulfurimonas sp. RIFOXYD12_FULL_33_39]|uniref:hypothetical protein n=1 Tax=unclassified Sulfurimonas TaxID=2623549 RepID=UPI0008BD4D8B|nr:MULTISPECIES: hypothetical protein [unclassified Sulfurimonas]OHE10035.1 MAG: hypothetical protein A2513_08015 [Sulfurimonas sp. RIFOXYD12_FULL_33_39]OHE14744.1 MAG: hypothetical protein A2530_02465 [Sulfurimonas sp. RIFOXYD2_FULL_34_21]
MNKIKIISILIFLLSVTLALFFNYISEKNIAHNEFLNTINEQKDFTQEISKNIFYIHKDKECPTNSLDSSIKNFLYQMNAKEQKLQLSKEIITLWNEFYFLVQDFRNQIKVKSIYSNIILEKEVRDIYNTNLKLIVEFDKLIKKEQENFDSKQNIYILTQYFLFAGLVLLLIYLFTQLKSTIAFIQKFLLASKTVLTNSSIKGLAPIDILDKNEDVSQASKNFNALLKKVNDSILNSSNSIEHSYKSLEILEQNIEDIIELIYEMSEKTRDKELIKKEDAIIQSLEELSSSTKSLKNVKSDLDDLISHYMSYKA